MSILGWIFGKREIDCPEVRKLASSYLEEALRPSRMERLRAHLSGCGPCRAFVSSLSSVIGTLARLPTVPAPQTLKQSIIDTARKNREGAERRD